MGTPLWYGVAWVLYSWIKSWMAFTVVEASAPRTVAQEAVSIITEQLFPMQLCGIYLTRFIHQNTFQMKLGAATGRKNGPNTGI